MQGYRISNNFNEIDLSFVHAFIGQSYWAKGIPLETLRTALKHSLCFAVFEASGAQVGFARVITDSATFAYLSDVFIADAHRGQGLSKWLMDAILAHPSLQGLRRFVLATQDAHGLYDQFGFKPLTYPQMFMEIWTPDIYTRSR